MTENTVTLANCKCGCKQQVGSVDSLYRPGHDARHAGDIARRILDDGNREHLNLLPTDALKAKSEALAVKWMTAAEAKAEKAAAREAAKVAKAAEANGEQPEAANKTRARRELAGMKERSEKAAEKATAKK